MKALFDHDYKYKENKFIMIKILDVEMNETVTVNPFNLNNLDAIKSVVK